jgi:hypothetical protein
MRAILGLITVLMAVFATSVIVHSQGIFEKLVMPGPLIEGHAKLEKDCSNCHEPFAHKSQSALCLACHKDTRADREARRRFHGRQPEAANSECKHCHVEHKGRSADIVQLNRETFNHALTNFMLVGAHRRASCNGCHANNARFRDAPAHCINCHASIDPHKGRLGEKCDGCHNEEDWRRAKGFDHGKTRFALVGAHSEVTCAKCHAGERYKDLPRLCISCHRLQDAHAGRYGSNCQTCHTPKDWKTVQFNHDRATQFPLRGGHAKVACTTCHTGELYGSKLATACIACHRKDEPHKGQLGSRCEKCHNESGWRSKIAFDHDLSRFPLAGLHAVVPCEECHRTQSYKDAPHACESCHRDTHHVGRLGTNCANCHNPNGWTRWRFDHDRQTRYALTGAHAGLHCHACHAQTNVENVTAPTACYACHGRDDAHQGSLGRACEKCHSTVSFNGGSVRR